MVHSFPLFVYGSLKRNRPGHRLLGAVRSIVDATIDGHLYHLPGGYPALVRDAAALSTPHRVAGELVTVADPAGVVSRLDRFEDEGTLYLRQTLEVSTDRGPTPAVVYVWNCVPENPLPEGARRLQPGPGTDIVRW